MYKCNQSISQLNVLVVVVVVVAAMVSLCFLLAFQLSCRTKGKKNIEE